MLGFICNGSVDLFGTGRGQKFKMKIYASSGIRTQPRQSKTGKSAPQTARPRGFDGDQWFNVLQDNGLQIKKKTVR